MDIFLGILALVSLPAGVFLQGWVLTLFWKWFITPVFFGAPELKLFPAIGLLLVVALFIYRPKKTKFFEDKRSIRERSQEMIIWSLVPPLTFLFFGWVVKLFI